MKLTRKKAIELCIELWTWCMETGKQKEDWPKWDEYGNAMSYCWFCEYDNQMRTQCKRNRLTCGYCPFVTSGLGVCRNTYFENWANAKTPRTRKKYAKLFLAQIKTLRQER